MNPNEYGKMFSLEDHYWWFVGRRRLALGLLMRALQPDQAKRFIGRRRLVATVLESALRPVNPVKWRILDLGCGTGVVLRDLSP